MYPEHQVPGWRKNYDLAPFYSHTDSASCADFMSSCSWRLPAIVCLPCFALLLAPSALDHAAQHANVQPAPPFMTVIQRLPYLYAGNYPRPVCAPSWLPPARQHLYPAFDQFNTQDARSYSISLYRDPVLRDHADEVYWFAVSWSPYSLPAPLGPNTMVNADTRPARLRWGWGYINRGTGGNDGPNISWYHNRVLYSFGRNLPDGALIRVANSMVCIPAH